MLEMHSNRSSFTNKMAKAIISSIVLLLMVMIILSLLVDAKAFAAHRKLNGAMERVTIKRNLQGDGQKRNANRSISPRSGQRNTNKEPSKTRPNVIPPSLTHKTFSGKIIVCDPGPCSTDPRPYP